MQDEESSLSRCTNDYVRELREKYLVVEDRKREEEGSEDTDKLSFSKEEDEDQVEERDHRTTRMRSPTNVILQAQSLHSIGELLYHSKFDETIHKIRTLQPKPRIVEFSSPRLVTKSSGFENEH